MNAREAMSHAAGGGKLSCKGWPKSYFVHFNSNGRLVDSDGDLYNFPINANNWEVYQEPPKGFTFLELFDVLKEDEYAETIEPNGIAFLITIGRELKQVLGHTLGKMYGDNQFNKSQFVQKYIIKKKPSQPVKEKEGLNFDGESCPNSYR